jgi:molybdopterin-containing oxidoreductase family molybdopterin binding subunit
VSPAVANGDRRIHSACDVCYASCGIVAHVRNGALVKIDGDPNCPASGGRLCAKGQASVIALYDPSRVRVPLLRTNPEKGIGVDPGWKEIPWDEALDLLTERLRRVRETDPRKLVIATFDHTALAYFIRPTWAVAFGTPNADWVGYYCGNYLHAAMYLTNGSFHSDFDVDHCNYVILLGNQQGFMAGLNANVAAHKMAAARKRGMRVVVVDPVGTNAAAKADEWVPIRPGTDGALVLGLINVLLNELGCYDREFLSQRTNAAYLVGEDGRYIREDTGKPLVWDLRRERAVPFDTEAATAALDGTYVVGEHACQPALQRLIEHVRAYTPEQVAATTTVPAAVVRRIAREFGAAARIGSTITIDGQVLPYRPVAVNIYRGAGAHKHGTHTALAVQTLNMIVGACYVPGGHRGVNIIGPQGRWRPGETTEGLLTPPAAIGRGARYYEFEADAPADLGLRTLFPITTNRSPLYEINLRSPDRSGLPYVPEVLLVCRRNLMMNNANPAAAAEMLRQIPFVVVFGLHVDETAEMADLVLPDAHFLERLDLFPNRYTHTMSPATGQFYWGIRQPVLDQPLGQARRWIDVLYEVAGRLGFLGDVYKLLNVTLGLSEPYRLDPSAHYTFEDIYDHWAKSLFGPERGLAWFKTHGYHKVPRTVEERYPGPFIRARYPVYYENMLDAGVAVREVAARLGTTWDTSDYQPLPTWKACPAFADGMSSRDLYVVNYKLPFHSLSFTTQNPWLNELAERHPYAYRILLNADTGRRKGIRDGDHIWVESEAGRVSGQVRLTELIHPEVVGIAGVFGSWARRKPVARGKGVHFNALVPISLDRLDPISTGVDACVRVSVYPVGGTSR